MATNMFASLKGRVALITGAASGMGEATAKKFASLGMKVAVVDFDAQKGAAVVEQIRQAGGEAIFVKCDITEEEQIKAAVNTVTDTYGKLNAVINCASIGCAAAVVHEFETDVFDRLMKINVRGTFLMMKYGAEGMLKTKSENCSIVNLSSVAGIIATPGAAGYTASKFAVIGLTKNGAVDYAQHGITVNAICPYFVRTGFLKGVTEEQFKMMEQAYCPNGRAANPEEIADAALYLISDMARYVNGEILSVDAGKTAGDIGPLEWKTKY